MSHPAYWNTLDQIYHCQWTAHKLAHLEEVKGAIAQCWPKGHPTRFIQVAGTNGKGTVGRFLEACFSMVGIAGTVASPHLFDYRERFTIQGSYVSQRDIIDAWENTVLPCCVQSVQAGHEPSYSLVYILIALVLFEKYQVVWGIMETGLGGRYDPITALEVEAVVLTNVGNDHRHILGENLWQRVLDKSGICRKGKPFFTADACTENRDIMALICDFYGAPFFSVGDQEIEAFQNMIEEMPDNKHFKVLHNLRNGALSLAVARYLLNQENHVLDSVCACKNMDQIHFPGRFEQIEPQIYIDIAHNLDKINALVDQIRADQTLLHKKKIFILGLSGHRDPKEVLAPLVSIANSIIVTSTPKEGVDPEEIKRVLDALSGESIKIQVIAEPEKALAQARKELDEDSVIIATGSTFVLDQLFNPDAHIRALNRMGAWRTRNTTI